MAGDCVTTIDGKPPLEFLRSEWWPRSDDTPIRLKLRQRKMGEPVSACALNDPIFDRSDGLLFEIVKYVGAIGDEVR
jgi:hypothetical protein